jgi:hypothetical protein
VKRVLRRDWSDFVRDWGESRRKTDLPTHVRVLGSLSPDLDGLELIADASDPAGSTILLHIRPPSFAQDAPKQEANGQPVRGEQAAGGRPRDKGASAQTTSSAAEQKPQGADEAGGASAATPTGATAAAPVGESPQLDERAAKKAAQRAKEQREAAGKKSEDAKDWRDLLAAVAIRAGYRLPELDFAELNKLRVRSGRRRLELILDTNALSNGVGQWMARAFGHRADLVRSTVGEKEIQRLGDVMKVRPGSLNHVRERARFLAASRFLEDGCHEHVLWRRIHTESESSLHVANGADGPTKSPGHDLLLLEAARRALEEQVPGLQRVLVTSDKTLARAATHVLPADGLFVAYQQPLPDVDHIILTPYTWWGGLRPTAFRPNGGMFSDLATFVWEALSVWSVIELQHADGHRLRVSAFEPGRSAFPSDWSPARLWVEELSSAPTGGVVQVAPSPVSARRAEEGPGSHEHEPWPLVGHQTVELASVARVRVSVEDAIAAVDLAVTAPPGASLEPLLQRREPSRHEQDPLELLRAIGLADDAGCVIEETRGRFARAWRRCELDELASFFTRWAPFAMLMSTISQTLVLSQEDVDRIAGRQSSLVVGLATALGQVVRVPEGLRWGGAPVDREVFEMWLLELLGKGEIAVEDLATEALGTLHVSPVRLARAVPVVLNAGALGLEPVVGGSQPVRELAQRVLFVQYGAVTLRSRGVGELFPFRSLKVRS